MFIVVRIHVGEPPRHLRSREAALVGGAQRTPAVGPYILPLTLQTNPRVSHKKKLFFHFFAHERVFQPCFRGRLATGTLCLPRPNGQLHKNTEQIAFGSVFAPLHENG